MTLREQIEQLRDERDDDPSPSSASETEAVAYAKGRRSAFRQVLACLASPDEPRTTNAAKEAVLNLNGEQWPEDGEWQQRIIEQAIRRASPDEAPPKRTVMLVDGPADPFTATKQKVAPDEAPSGWQPIETAPKDGSRFLGGWHHKIHGWCWAGCRWETRGVGIYATPYPYAESGGRPTHWTEMPTPPVVPEDRRSEMTKDNEDNVARMDGCTQIAEQSELPRHATSPSVETLPEKIERYGVARRKQLAVRRRMAAIGCEWKDSETAACHRMYSLEEDKCESCQRREPIYHEWLLARREEKTILRQLQRRLEGEKRGEKEEAQRCDVHPAANVRTVVAEDRRG